MKHTFKKQQLLNVTTGRLWTSMDDIYKLFDECIEPGVMTHMLPNCSKAWMATIGTREPFKSLPTEGWDPKHTSNENITFEITDEDKKEFWAAYGELPSLLADKKVVAVHI